MNLNKLTGTVKAGAKRAIEPKALAVVGGFAGSRLVERAAYTNFRGVFGTNTGPGSLTSQQRTARVALKAAAVVLVGGTLLTNRSPIAQGAAIGLMGGWTWHILNDFGVNV